MCISANLITHTVQPNEIERTQKQDVFDGLQKRWWMQVYDGKYHKHGHKVFDEGLHGKAVEPGFYTSARNAHEFASQHLEHPVDVPFYRELHRTACAHFEGRKNCTEMTANETGVFNPAQRSCFCFSKFLKSEEKSLLRESYKLLGCHETLWADDDIAIEKRQRWFMQRRSESAWFGERYLESDFDAFIKEAKAALQFLDACFRHANTNITALNQDILKRCEQLEAQQFAFLERVGASPTSVMVYYHYALMQGIFAETQVPPIVERLFKKFHGEMEQANTDDEKIKCIADLFQMLEWLHPFHDGQGRTDLILLSKLLCQYGFNPAILEEPYVSTYFSLDDWVNYLKKGMEKWRCERDKTQDAEPTA